MKTILTGITASGNMHIGNYIGAIHNALRFSRDNKCIFFVADLHGITTKWEPKKLGDIIREVLICYLAAGFEKDNCHFFLQSQNPDHSYLAWLFDCVIPVTWMQNMIQYKEKVKKYGIDASMGLMNYPALMAADILLYNPVFIPVGADQQKHVELTRDIAQRINRVYGEIFSYPQAVLPVVGSRTRNLQHPNKKMSKSDHDQSGVIQLLESPDSAVKKIKRAVTDSVGTIAYDPENRPEVSNLIDIYSLFAGISVEQVVLQYEGKGYADFKKDLAEIMYQFLVNFQKKYFEISSNPEYVNAIIEKGLIEARKISSLQIAKVKDLMGFVEKF
ncbi:MAG: tryptophan--tRNA ligase [Candidatus Dojkabacteria bacterium]